MLILTLERVGKVSLWLDLKTITNQTWGHKFNFAMFIMEPS